MDCIEIFPSLSHLIETATREEFWNSVNQYMKSGHKEKEIDEMIELRKDLVESTNFRKLGNQSERYLTEVHIVQFGNKNLLCYLS